MTTAATRPRTSPTAATRPQPADVLVIFGITGDLARVMTFRSLYRLERRGLLACPIVGVAVDDWTVEHLRDHARECEQEIRQMLSGKRYLGIEVEEKNFGLMVKTVAPESPAWRSGLEVGDRGRAARRLYRHRDLHRLDAQHAAGRGVAERGSPASGGRRAHSNSF